jgi:hypothetical protein
MSSSQQGGTTTTEKSAPAPLWVATIGQPLVTPRLASASTCGCDRFAAVSCPATGLPFSAGR